MKFCRDLKNPVTHIQRHHARISTYIYYSTIRPVCSLSLQHACRKLKEKIASSLRARAIFGSIPGIFPNEIRP